MDGIEIALFAARMTAACEEMGACLRNAAFSPNIRERLDYSCAVFAPDGRLSAQAAHIPVHLGSMAYAMRDVVGACDWSPGDLLLLNDPFLGGTHLPDVTVVTPVFHGKHLVAFVANRAHHADIGADAPGSMPLSTRLEDEGIVIAPTLLARAGRTDAVFLDAMLARLRDPAASRGDFAAQAAAAATGCARIGALVKDLGTGGYARALAALDAYGGTLARSGLAVLPFGHYRFADVLDDDGAGTRDLPILVDIAVDTTGVEVDFAGTAPQAPGNVNCPLSVAAAAVYYVFHALMPAQTPLCAGALAPVRLRAPRGSLVNALRPAAVAAGNVETSTRIVDTVLGALADALPARIPAASHGSMNNVAMGGRTWAYYETIGGGGGAHAGAAGQSGVQTHMTNTLNTPIEVLESTWPLRVRHYGLRRGSGGAGLHPGGDGLVREYEFLEPTRVTVLAERRWHAPWGLAGGASGARGRTLLDGRELPPKVALDVPAGARLRVESGGGGGWGAPGDLPSGDGRA